jgi:hypothetical protein
MQMSATDAIYISRDDPHDIRAWSGTTYFMGKTLEAAGFRLSYIGPLKTSFLLRRKSETGRFLWIRASFPEAARQIPRRID